MEKPKRINYWLALLLGVLNVPLAWFLVTLISENAPTFGKASLSIAFSAPVFLLIEVIVTSCLTLLLLRKMKKEAAKEVLDFFLILAIFFTLLFTSVAIPLTFVSRLNT